MRLFATALLAALLLAPTAFAVEPTADGGAILPPSGGASAPEPEPEPTAPPMVPVEEAGDSARPAADPAGAVEVDVPAPAAPKARPSQRDDGYAEVQVPMPGAEPVPDAAGSAATGGTGLASTGLEVSLVAAAGMSLLGAGLIMLGFMRRNA